MSYYSVTADGTDILTAISDCTLADPVVVQSLSSAGTLDFTMPRGHAQLSSMTLYASTIIAKEDGDTIFHGRPVSATTDSRGNVTYHCEDALAWLNDVHLPPSSQPSHPDGVDSPTYCQEILNYYNSKVGASRQITTAALPSSGTNTNADRAWRGQTCFEALADECRSIDGVMFVRGTGLRLVVLSNYISGLSVNSQTIEVGKNLADIKIESQPIYSAVYATGKDGIAATDSIASRVSTYGYIEAVRDIPSATTVSALQILARAWLNSQTPGAVDITARAVDLHSVDSTQQRFDIGRKVRLVGTPWGLGQIDLPTLKVTCNLSTCHKEIELGTSIKRRTLTQMARIME